MVNTELNNGTTRRNTLTVAALALASMALPSALKFFQGSNVTKEEKSSPDHELNIISLGLKESQICAILAARGEHKTMQDVAISQGAPHGSNLCLKADVVKAI